MYLVDLFMLVWLAVFTLGVAWKVLAWVGRRLWPNEQTERIYRWATIFTDVSALALALLSLLWWLS